MPAEPEPSRRPRGSRARRGSAGSSPGSPRAGSGTRAANVVRSPERADAATGERAAALARELVEQLGQMRGAAMKVGQVLSTIDFTALPEERARELQADAREAARRRPAAAVQAGREAAARGAGGEAGGGLRGVRARRRSPPPRSARSTARSRTRGTTVAVKVQYPGVAEAVDTDLRNLTLLLPLVKRLAPGLDVKAIYAELRERIAEELDYELEAQNQRAVARAHRGHPFAHVPEVHTELSSRRVLVTDLLRGARFEVVKRARRGDPRPLRRDRLPLLLRARAPHRRVSRRPAPGQLPAARRRPRRLPRLRADARARPRLPRPRGVGRGRGRRRRRARRARGAGRARVPAGARDVRARGAAGAGRGDGRVVPGAGPAPLLARLRGRADRLHERPAVTVVRADAPPDAAAAGAAAAAHGGARALRRSASCARARTGMRSRASTTPARRPRRRSARPRPPSGADVQAAA